MATVVLLGFDCKGTPGLGRDQRWCRKSMGSSALRTESLTGLPWQRQSGDGGVKHRCSLAEMATVKLKWALILWWLLEASMKKPVQ